MRTNKGSIHHSDEFIFNVYFENEASIQFKVTKVGSNYRTIFGPVPREARLSRIGKSMNFMLPTPSMLGDHNSRNHLGKFFSLMVDQESNTYRGVRFDEWLIHNILGVPYNSPSLHISYYYSPSEAYWNLLADAYEVIGVKLTAATRRAIQDPANDARIYRWFLLYAAQASNRLEDQNGNLVNLQQWIATNVDEVTLGRTSAEILAMTTGEFAQFVASRAVQANGEVVNDDLFWWLWGFGFDERVGGGFDPLS